MKRVVVYGATGFTGRLVVRALLDLGVSDVVLAGRSAPRLGRLAEELGGLETRVADARDAKTLGPMAHGAHVVVDTVGPFLELGEPVVRAALDAGAHFLDTTGEQAYLHTVKRAHHSRARAAGLAVVNAHAFEFALGYCVAALVAETDGSVDTIDVFNRVQGFGATRGTQKSALGALAQPALVLREGRLVPRGASPSPKRVVVPGIGRTELAAPFPGGEALHLPDVYPRLRNVTTNLVAPRLLARGMTALFALQPLYRALHARGALAFVERRIEAGPEGPDDATRRSQKFHVFARGRGPDAAPWAMVTGEDPYGITGVIAALGAKLLLEGPPDATGVVSTDQAFGAARFLSALEPFGVALSRGDGAVSAT